MITRRAFLRSTVTPGAAVAVSAAIGVGCSGLGRGGAGGGVLDTHTHFYDPRRPGGVPWPPEKDTFLHRPVLPREFEQMAVPLGVSGTVVVEASPLESDNDWLLALAERHPVIEGVVGHLKPGRPGFGAQLESYAQHPRFCGIRTGGWGLPVPDSRERPGGDFALLASRGLALDVLVGPHELDRVGALAAAVPELRLVIDHVGNVPIDGGPAPGAWVEAVKRCASHANVFMKFSGLVEGTGRSDGTAPAGLGYYAAVAEVALREFGPQRLMFGSNWPVSARFASYDVVLGIARQFAAAHLRGADAEAFFSGTARRFYGLARRRAA